MPPRRRRRRRTRAARAAREPPPRARRARRAARRTPSGDQLVERASCTLRDGEAPIGGGVRRIARARGEVDELSPRDARILTLCRSPAYPAAQRPSGARARRLQRDVASRPACWAIMPIRYRSFARIRGTKRRHGADPRAAVEDGEARRRSPSSTPAPSRRRSAVSAGDAACYDNAATGHDARLDGGFLLDLHSPPEEIVDLCEPEWRTARRRRRAQAVLGRRLLSVRRSAWGCTRCTSWYAERATLTPPPPPPAPPARRRRGRARAGRPPARRAELFDELLDDPTRVALLPVASRRRRRRSPRTTSTRPPTSCPGQRCAHGGATRDPQAVRVGREQGAARTRRSPELLSPPRATKATSGGNRVNRHRAALRGDA